MTLQIRHLLFFIIFMLSNISTLFPQSFHGGILAGFIASQVDGDSYSGYNKAGLQGGVFITADLNHNMGARLEIKYTGRGAHSRLSDDNTNVYILRLHYIDLPLLATLKIKSIGSVELGIVPGYMFSAGGEDDGGKMPKDFLVDFRKFDLGTLIGLSVNITSKLALNARYSYSIFSIRDLESAGSYYSWFGKLFGHSKGDFNNYLSLGINYQLK